MAIATLEVAFVAKADLYIFWLDVEVGTQLLDLSQAFWTIDGAVAYVPVADIAWAHVFYGPTIVTAIRLTAVEHAAALSFLLVSVVQSSRIVADLLDVYGMRCRMVAAVGLTRVQIYGGVMPFGHAESRTDRVHEGC